MDYKFLTHKTRPVLTIIALTISIVLWGRGLFDSPVFMPEKYEEQHHRRNLVKEEDPDYREEKVCAEAYWQRYPDIEKNDYFGREGPLGIAGPWEHYTLYGRREGRIWAPIIKADDVLPLAPEKNLMTD